MPSDCPADGSQPAARAAIARLVADHHAELYRYAYRLAGQTADAEDLTQQTFLIAQAKFDQLRSADSCRSWLFSILRSCFLKSLRTAIPAPATAIDLPLETIAAPAGDLTIDRERLHAALRELPAEFRLVLSMFYFEGCSYREIAEQLGLPQGTVMSRLSRGKSQLRSALIQRERAEVGGAATRRTPEPRSLLAEESAVHRQGHARS